MLFNKPVSIAMRKLRKVDGEIVAEDGAGAGLEESFMPLENRDEEQIGNDMSNPMGSEFMGLGADDDDMDMAPGKSSIILINRSRSAIRMSPKLLLKFDTDVPIL